MFTKSNSPHFHSIVPGVEKNTVLVEILNKLALLAFLFNKDN